MSHIPMGATFARLVDMALLREEDKGGKKEVKVEVPLDKKVEGSQNKGTDSKKDGKNNKPRDKRKCKFCGIPGHLIKDCRKKKRKMCGCFQCGKTWHMAKGCPKRQGQGQRTGSTSRGQIHALIAPPHERGRNIFVESLVYLSDHPVRTLFDSGASHFLCLLL